ncbi:hypothetical protein COOONC_23308 [Cooperia oncophora]
MTSSTNGISKSGVSTATRDPLPRSQSQPKTATVTRHVYEVETLTHEEIVKGRDRKDPTGTTRKISPSTRSTRETTIDDPYYPPVVYRNGTPNTGRHSSYEMRPKTSASSLTNPRKTPVETLIDFRAEGGPSGASVQPDPVPYFSLKRSHSADRVDTIPSSGKREFVVALRKNPEYNRNNQQYQDVPSFHTGNGTSPARDSANQAVISGTNVHLSNNAPRFPPVQVEQQSRGEPFRERDGMKQGYDPSYSQFYDRPTGAIPLYGQPPIEGSLPLISKTKISVVFNVSNIHLTLCP